MVLARKYLRLIAQCYSVAEMWSLFLCLLLQTYRDADMSLARPGRKQANVSVRMA
jgi:hypothetical protein